jgi:hypothetical protein
MENITLAHLQRLWMPCRSAKKLGLFSFRVTDTASEATGLAWRLLDDALPCKIGCIKCANFCSLATAQGAKLQRELASLIRVLDVPSLSRALESLKPISPSSTCE